MDTFCICRTCLIEPNTNLISIYSEITLNENDLIKNENKTQITKLLDELTGNKYTANEFPYPDKICEICLNELKAAVDFKHRCLIAFGQLMSASTLNDKFEEQIGELPLPSDDLEFVDSKINSAIEIIEDICIEPLVILPITKDEPQEDIKTPKRFKETSKITKSHSSRRKPDIPSATERIQYECENCGRKFNRKTHLRRHMTIHTDERAFACELCDKKFRRADHLKIHANHHAQIKPHFCEECQKSFSRAEHLRRHIACRHTKKSPSFTCSTCKFVASSMKDLNQHKKTHHTENQFTCKFCDEIFPTKTELNEHGKKHNDERPFLCCECGLRFIRNDYLVIHLRRHTGEKPYKCRFCDRAFPRATDLTVHERYHTGEKKHTCSVCGKGFHRAYNLTVHMRVHTGEKPYQCPHCTRSFSQGNDLKAHIRRHTGERYQCEYCSSSFIQIYLLNNHKKNVHSIDTKSNISRVAKVDSLSEEPQAGNFNQECETNRTEYAENEY